MLVTVHLILILLMLLLIMLLLVCCQGPIALSQPVLVALCILLYDEFGLDAAVRCISEGH